MMKPSLAILLLFGMLSGCDSSEENVITETSPFFSLSVNSDSLDRSHVISEVRQFLPITVWIFCCPKTNQVPEILRHLPTHVP